MKQNDLQRLSNCKICPGDSKLNSDEEPVNIDNGSMGGSHWSCFILKDKKSYYFDRFGTKPDKFLQKQLPKPITYHNFKIQDINSKLCGP